MVSFFFSQKGPNRGLIVPILALMFHEVTIITIAPQDI